MVKYIVLKCIADMCRTLETAALYLIEKQDISMKADLTENGVLMLQQMQNVLSEHPKDVLNKKVTETTQRLLENWKAQCFDKELLEQIESLRQMLPKAVCHQLRVVLYAELGQKWDSLASIYDFMKEDPRFDVAVVLMPIFRTDEQGNIKSDVIYTDYLTELGIPFYHFQQYDIEEDQPDLAFICQPYDTVTLTQFSPRYIADRTRMVYTMYYMPGIVEVGEKCDLATLPCYHQAWRVVGNSQKHYNYYSRYSEIKGSNMRVTGLPKTDALVRLKKEGTALPTAWEKLCGRKIFLWNTWYDVPRSSAKFMQNMLHFFGEHPEYGLIWRPHPMTKSVNQIFQSPLFCQQYSDILAYANKMENIVVDEYSSIDAAFYYSDALISDFSSLISQYLIMDKPILMVDNKFIKIDETAGIMQDACLERTDSFEGIISFIERIAKGEDRRKGLRQKSMQEDFPLMDGHCAERLCNLLYDEMIEEDFE